MSDDEEEFYGFEDSELALPAPEILKTTKNKDLLSYRGFIYYQNRKPIDQTFYWECRGRSHFQRMRGKKCAARVVTLKANGLHTIQSAKRAHNHVYDPEYIAEIKYRNCLKRRATEDSSGPAKVIRMSSVTFPDSVQQRFSAEAQRKVVHRARRVNAPVQKEPDSLDSFFVPDNLQKTVNGDKFLLADLRDGPDRALIFGTCDSLTKLSSSKYWVVDGTFDSVPTLFRQLLTIHGSCAPTHEHVFPMIYVLMTSKAEVLYRKVFAAIIGVAEDLDIDLNPSVILSDFEKPIINACHTEFPAAKLSGCFFHMSMNHWKHVQKYNLTNTVRDNKLCYDCFKSTQALAFLPPDKIADAFVNIKTKAPSQMGVYLSYVEEYYVLGRARKATKDGRVIRGAPLYSPEFWSVHNNILSNIPRTTNQIEAWHRRWSTLEERHIGLLKIIGDFREEEKFSRGQILAYLSGNTSKCKTTVSLTNDAKIFKVVEQFDKYTVEEFMKAIAINLGSKGQ